MSGAAAGPPALRDLGDGLVLRKSSLADRERIATFHANTLVRPDETPPLDRIQYFLLDLLGGEHPTGRPDDFFYVEEVSSGRIVSAAGLYSAHWTFDGVPLSVGQVDMVSTDPAYRRRGLVAAQMAELHARSARLGHLMQVIPGIPWYYRQFGYEYALNLEGGRIAYRATVPPLPGSEQETYALRPLRESEIPFLETLYQQACARSLLAVRRDAAFWRFDAFGRHGESGLARDHVVVVDAARPDIPIGAAILARRLWDRRLEVRFLELAQGTPWSQVVPSLLRGLDGLGQQVAARTSEPCEAINFDLGAVHPLFDAIPEALPREVKPYAWYVRVPDVPHFLRAIAPVLERRLAGSAEAGWTGELRLSFYRSGVLLCVSGGQITAEEWRPAHAEDGEALFPDLIFLKLLLGYRSLTDLEYAYPDCLVTSPAARALLPILFPQRYSHVWDPT